MKFSHLSSYKKLNVQGFNFSFLPYLKIVKNSSWGLTVPQTLEGVAGKDGVTFFRGVAMSKKKTQLKSEIFLMTKKVYEQKVFSAITKNSN